MTPAQRTRRSGSSVNQGRRAALRALLRIEAGEPSDQALAAEAPPRGPDRALAWHLVYGVLQHQAELDFVIDALSRRRAGRIERSVRLVLRLGLFELRHGRAPAHAVVHQAVSLCHTSGLRRAAGFVNALLRRQQQAPEPPARVALNHPDWLLERWEERHGAAEAARWARSNNRPAPLSLALNGAQPALAAQLSQAGHEVLPAIAAGRPVPGMLQLRGPTGPVSSLPGWQEGRWWVQDPAAAAVTDLLGIEAGWRVLDACAAPGGKTFRLAATGAEVTAVDASAQRLAMLAERLVQLDLQATQLQHDWLQGELPVGAAGQGSSLFHGILVDAPCSGLGTLRKHPEIRWRRSPADLLRNSERQLGILISAARLLQPGGVLVYAVCTPEPEEGERVVQRFQQLQPTFTLDRVLCTAPPTHDEDAFWAARLRRG